MKKKKRAVIMVLYLSGIKLIFSRSCWVRVSSPSPITEHVNELLSVLHSEQDRGDGKCWHSCLLTHTHTQGRPSPSVSQGHRRGSGVSISSGRAAFATPHWDWNAQVIAATATGDDIWRPQNCRSLRRHKAVQAISNNSVATTQEHQVRLPGNWHFALKSFLLFI